VTKPGFYHPGRLHDRQRDAVVDDRKALFAELNAFVTERGGWLTSIPGETVVELQTLPGSTLPADVEARFGCGPVVEIGETQRILATAVVHHFSTGADGALELLTLGSTRPVTMSQSHAGICRVVRFSFDLPQGRSFV
jgi:hypothetical protein